MKKLTILSFILGAFFFLPHQAEAYNLFYEQLDESGEVLTNYTFGQGRYPLGSTTEMGFDNGDHQYFFSVKLIGDEPEISAGNLRLTCDGGTGGSVEMTNYALTSAQASAIDGSYSTVTGAFLFSNDVSACGTGSTLYFAFDKLGMAGDSYAKANASETTIWVQLYEDGPVPGVGNITQVFAPLILPEFHPVATTSPVFVSFAYFTTRPWVEGVFPRKCLVEVKVSSRYLTSCLWNKCWWRLCKCKPYPTIPS